MDPETFPRKRLGFRWPGPLLPYRGLGPVDPDSSRHRGRQLTKLLRPRDRLRVRSGLIARSLGYKDVASALVAMAQILEGIDPLAAQ